MEDNAEHEWPLGRLGGRYALDFVPPTHQHLRVLRLFLPFVANDGLLHRWSDFERFRDASAAVSWAEAADGALDPQAMVYCRGVADRSTLDALSDIVGGVVVRALVRTGYGQFPTDAGIVGESPHSYRAIGPVPLLDLNRDPLPEFVMDGGGQFAWGARAYPDSLVIAASDSFFRAFHEDTRLDTISVVVDRDILPPSAGD